jgi:uncharacterized membrane protein
LALIFKRESGFVRQHAIVSLLFSVISWTLPLVLYGNDLFAYTPLLTYFPWILAIIGLLIALTGHTWPLFPIKPTQADYQIQTSAGAANQLLQNPSKKLRSFAMSNILLVFVSLLAFSPLLFGFLIGFIEKGKDTALLSAFLFIGFMIALILRLLTQSYLYSQIARLIPDSEVNSSTQLREMYSKLPKSYGFAVGKTIVLLSGLIPVLHLLTIFIAVPAGALLFTEYSERKFFIDINQYLQRRQGAASIAVGLLYISLTLFLISVPLLAVALWYGLQNVGF